MKDSNGRVNLINYQGNGSSASSIGALPDNGQFAGDIILNLYVSLSVDYSPSNYGFWLIAHELVHGSGEGFIGIEI